MKTVGSFTNDEIYLQSILILLSLSFGQIID